MVSGQLKSCASAVKISVRVWTGVTALHMAAEFNHLDIMKLLLTHRKPATSPELSPVPALSWLHR